MASTKDMTEIEKYEEQQQVEETTLPSQLGDGSAPEDVAPAVFTPAEEKAVVWKLDKHLVPMVFGLFMLSFLDRSNIGNAQAAGMSTSLGFSSAQYQWLLTMFYIGYVLGQPMTLLWKVIPARIFVSVLTLCWGIFALLQAAVFNFAGFMVLRLFLGFAETAFGPGVPYYLSFFYKRREVGLRQALFLGGAPIATAYAGTLAYGLTHINSAAIANWRILFIVEGFPVLIAAPLAWYYLPNRASTARFLTEREKEVALARGVQDGNSGHEKGLSFKGVTAGLKDPICYIHGLMYFSCNVSYSSLPVFLPTILTDMGFSSIRAQGLTAPPYLFSFFVLVGCAFWSDRRQDRSIFIIPLALLAASGYLILTLAESTAARYFAVFLCALIFPVIAIILPWTSNTHEDDSKRGAAFMLLNTVGQCGPFLGTRLYPAAQGPYYVKGMAICSAFMFFVAFLAAALRLLMIRENKRRDLKFGYVDPKVEQTESNFEEKETAEPTSTFRFIL